MITLLLHSFKVLFSISITVPPGQQVSGGWPNPTWKTPWWFMWAP